MLGDRRLQAEIALGGKHAAMLVGSKLPDLVIQSLQITEIGVHNHSIAPFDPSLTGKNETNDLFT